MAKTAEELNAIKEEISALFEKIKDLGGDDLNQITGEIESQLKEIKKSEVSVNFEEDTVPVKDRDLAQGLRNY